MTYFTWHPPSSSPWAGSSITFGDSAPYLLTSVDGLGNTLTQPLTHKAPMQAGETAVGLSIHPRIIAISVSVFGSTPQELFNHRQELAKLLTSELSVMGQKPELGRLVCHRDGLDPVEIFAMPQESPQFMESGAMNAVEADMEFYCPDPYWRKQLPDRTFMFAQSSVDFRNNGTVTSPMIIEIEGYCVDPIITNETTGESIQIMGTVASGERITIDTTFGKKTAVSSSGASVMGRIPLAHSRFPQLKPGLNRLSFRCTTQSGGAGATIDNYVRYSGV